MIEVGDVYWAIGADDDTGKIEWEEYIVRTIRKDKIYATQKNQWTWGKRSKKNGDFGWLDPVHSAWRAMWRVGDKKLPRHLATTRLQALRLALKCQQDWGDPSDYVDPTMHDRILKTFGSMITRERNKKKALLRGGRRA